MYRDSKTDELVVDWRKIGLTYMLYGRFWVDIVASLPLEIITFIFGDNGYWEFLGLLKLVRLLRLGRMISYIRTNRKFKFGMKILQLIFFILMVIHWVNCTWYYIAVNTKSWFPPKDIDFKSTVIFNEDNGNLEEYVLMYYYGMLTLQANEIIPTTPAEVMTATLLVFLGIVVIGVTIGEFSNLLAAITKKERE